MESLFIQISDKYVLYKSQYKKTDPYDWFCGPGSHMIKVNQTNTRVKTKLIFMCSAHILIHLNKNKNFPSIPGNWLNQRQDK